MKRLVLILAMLALSSSAAMAWDASNFKGHYRFREEGKNFDKQGAEGNYFDVGGIDADGHGGLTGWEYNDFMSASFPDAFQCKFNITGSYWIGSRGHIHLRFVYSKFADSPAICALPPGTAQSFDGSINEDFTEVSLTGIGGSSAISQGSLSR